MNQNENWVQRPSASPGWCMPPALFQPFLLLVSSVFFSIPRYRGKCFPFLELGPRENGASRKWRRQRLWARRAGQWCFWGADVRHEWSWDPPKPWWLRQQLRLPFHWQPHGLLPCFQPTLQKEDEENIKGKEGDLSRLKRPNRNSGEFLFVSTNSD